MELSERFLRVSASGISRVEPGIELDGPWEVGVLDTHLDVPNSGKDSVTVEKTYGKETFKDGTMDFTILYEIKQDGLVNEGARKAWIDYKYGNNAKKTQSSQFDIWNMKIHPEARKFTGRTVSNYLNDVFFKNNPDKKLTIHEIIAILNERMRVGASDHAAPLLNAVFAKTGGEKFVVRPPYFSVPSLDIVNGLVTMHVPYYVRKVYMRPSLRKILNFQAIKTYPLVHIDKIFTRNLFHVHSPLTGSHYVVDGGRGVVYQFYRESYIIRDPATMIHSVVESDKATEAEQNTLRILAPDLVESKPIGDRSEPWLRIIERKGGYVQYANPIYCDLKYNRLNRIRLSFMNSDTNTREILKSGWLTLHFRRKLKHE